MSVSSWCTACEAGPYSLAPAFCLNCGRAGTMKDRDDDVPVTSEEEESKVECANGTVPAHLGEKDNTANSTLLEVTLAPRSSWMITGDAGIHTLVPTQVLLVGRASPNEIVATLLNDFPNTGRRHGCIVVDQHDVALYRDLHSTNGSFVRSGGALTRLPDGQWHPVHSGWEIVLGQSTDQANATLKFLRVDR